MIVPLTKRGDAGRNGSRLHRFTRLMPGCVPQPFPRYPFKGILSSESFKRFLNGSEAHPVETHGPIIP